MDKCSGMRIIYHKNNRKYRKCIAVGIQGGNRNIEIYRIKEYEECTCDT